MWQFHFGGTNPVPGIWVEAVMEDGSYVKSSPSDDLRWHHYDLSYGVERYRVIDNRVKSEKITNFSLGAN